MSQFSTDHDEILSGDEAFQPEDPDTLIFDPYE